jgi:hypothetical protein
MWNVAFRIRSTPFLSGAFAKLGACNGTIIPSTNFAFRSDSARTSHETFAELVKEGNGVFFGTEEDED